MTTSWKRARDESPRADSDDECAAAPAPPLHFADAGMAASYDLALKMLPALAPPPPPPLRSASAGTAAGIAGHSGWYHQQHTTQAQPPAVGGSATSPPPVPLVMPTTAALGDRPGSSPAAPVGGDGGGVWTGFTTGNGAKIYAQPPSTAPSTV